MLSVGGVGDCQKLDSKSKYADCEPAFLHMKKK